jgi:hypothetical protein
VFKRAGGQCEVCFPWADRCKNPATEMDHWLGGNGRRRQKQSVETCWALCREHHGWKTVHFGGVSLWNRRFKDHCETYGYPFVAHVEHAPLPEKQQLNDFPGAAAFPIPEIPPSGSSGSRLRRKGVSEMLTQQQKKRLAKEARKLAMECVEGTAPRLGVDREFLANGKPCCSLGHVFARSGFRPIRPRSHFADIYFELPGSERRELVTANDEARDNERAAWVVFPLLALADALEADAPQAPPATPATPPEPGHG